MPFKRQIFFILVFLITCSTSIPNRLSKSKDLPSFAPVQVADAHLSMAHGRSLK